jgi:hypothetical protein
VLFTLLNVSPISSPAVLKYAQEHLSPFVSGKDRDKVLIFIFPWEAINQPNGLWPVVGYHVAVY